LNTVPIEVVVHGEVELTIRPEYEKLELPDLVTFQAGMMEEQRSQLRKFTCPSKCAGNPADTPASEQDEEYQHAITIARLENELAEIIQSVSPQRLILG
jgi:acyl-CoA synthetase (NDP forming)